MLIRDVDNLLFDSEVFVYVNWGVNGIDGVVLIVLGMVVYKNVILFIGDLFFYYDMNGLLMVKLNEFYINIVLVNNNGGGIFLYLF